MTRDGSLQFVQILVSHAAVKSAERGEVFGAYTVD
jgi:hypothetical protein